MCVIKPPKVKIPSAQLGGLPSTWFIGASYHYGPPIHSVNTRVNRLFATYLVGS